MLHPMAANRSYRVCIYVYMYVSLRILKKKWMLKEDEIFYFVICSQTHSVFVYHSTHSLHLISPDNR